MKYKVGDKVRIKTWKEMKEEYGEFNKRRLNTTITYLDGMEEDIKRFAADRIVEITRMHTHATCTIKEAPGWFWTIDSIKCLADREQVKKQVKVKKITRFDLMDLD